MKVRLGPENRGKEIYMVKYGIGQITDNEERLVGMCEQNDHYWRSSLPSQSITQ